MSTPTHEDATREYDYYAFISYCHHDEKWAKWLQTKLEQYRLPTALRNEIQSLPRDIKPVFRYPTDMPTGQLYKNIHKELDSSKKLIVICSPNAAQSEWVNTEVQHFIDAGRYDEIIPFLIGGEFSESKDECFPPALRVAKTEWLLAVSVKEHGRQDAFLLVVSGLLGIKFGQLKRLHMQRQRIKGLFRAAKILLAAAALAVSGYMAWDYYLPHEAYFVDYIEKEGLPEGIFELTKEQIRSMSGHYVIKTQYHRVQELSYRNSAGIPISHGNGPRLDRPSVAVYKPEKGPVSRVEYTDKNGKVLMVLNYTDRLVLDFVKPGGVGEPFALSGDFASLDTGMLNLNKAGASRSEIRRHILSYDEYGRLTSVLFKRNSENIPACDTNGIGGLIYDYDDMGRVVTTYYTDSDGFLTTTKTGVAGLFYVYNDQGDINTVAYFDNNADPIVNEQGWMIHQMVTDIHHNIVRSYYLDIHERLMLCNYGYAYAELDFDEFGNQTAARLYDTSFEPVLHKEGFSQYSKKYNEQGYETFAEYFGVDGEPVLLPEIGVSKSSFAYDESGNLIQCKMLGTNGENVLSHAGFAKWTARYDDRYNLTERVYYGVDDELIMTKDGFAKEVIVYNPDDTVSQREFFDNTNARVLTEKGYALVKYRYDARGNVAEEAFFGTQEEAILNNEGVAKQEMLYDEEGNMIKYITYGPDDQRILNNCGYAEKRINHIRDEYGGRQEMLFLGLQEEPVLTTFGYAKYIEKYDSRGNCTEILNLGLHDELVMSDQGFAKRVMKFDALGNRTEVAFYDDNLHLVLHEEGYAKRVSQFTERSDPIYDGFFDENDELTFGPFGYAEAIAVYDERFNRTELAFYGQNHELTVNDHYGFAKQTAFYDEQGTVLEVIYYDEKGAVTTPD